MVCSMYPLSNKLLSTNEYVKDVTLCHITINKLVQYTNIKMYINVSY